jgi:hypothetical protein
VRSFAYLTASVLVVIAICVGVVAGVSGGIPIGPHYVPCITHGPFPNTHPGCLVGGPRVTTTTIGSEMPGTTSDTATTATSSTT